jgi:hypothetical protein
MHLDIIYTASLDVTAQIITGVVLLVTVVSVYMGIRAMRKAKNDTLTKILYPLIILITVTVCVVSYTYSTRKYVLGNFDIAINRPAGDVVIHVPDILEIRPVKEAELTGLERIFADGGLFGYFGHYRSPDLGDMQWYATNKKNLVIIHTRKGDTFVISPDDKDFIGRILAKKADL